MPFKPLTRMSTAAIKDEIDRLTKYLDMNPDEDPEERSRCLDRLIALQVEYTERLDRLMGR